MTGSNPSFGYRKLLRPFGLAAMAMALVGLLGVGSAAAEGSTEVSPTTMRVECNPENPPEQNHTEGACVVFVNSPTAKVGQISGSIELQSDEHVEFHSIGSETFMLQPNSAQESTAAFVYVPRTPGVHTFTASYAGDATHGPSQASVQVTVAPLPTTAMSIECNPENLPEVNHTEGACLVRVTSPGSHDNITGNIKLQSDEHVEFHSIGSETFMLEPTSEQESTAIFVYTPSTAGVHTFTATYAGDEFHGPSQATLQVTVVPTFDKTSITTLSCNPMMLGQGSTCTLIIKDTEVDPAAPTGPVALSSTGSGRFTACKLIKGGPATSVCFFDYTPQARGTQTLTANYLGDEGHVGTQKSIAVQIR